MGRDQREGQSLARRCHGASTVLGCRISCVRHRAGRYRGCVLHQEVVGHTVTVSVGVCSVVHLVVVERVNGAIVIVVIVAEVAGDVPIVVGLVGICRRSAVVHLGTGGVVVVDAVVVVVAVHVVPNTVVVVVR